MSSIGFATNYDESTSSNFNVIMDVLPENSINLLATSAVRHNFLEALKAYPENDVFAFTHGDADRFYDNNDAVAYSINDNLFANRKVFIFACHTANILGKEAANVNCVYWGYTGQLAALEDDELSKGIFAKIMTDVLSNFHKPNTEEEVSKYIEKIHKMCMTGTKKLDDLCKENPNYNPIPAYKALHHIWSRLRVYFKSEHKILIHPDADSQDII